jgi:hypothetical protein
MLIFQEATAGDKSQLSKQLQEEKIKQSAREEEEQEVASPARASNLGAR